MVDSSTLTCSSKATAWVPVAGAGLGSTGAAEPAFLREEEEEDSFLVLTGLLLLLLSADSSSSILRPIRRTINLSLQTTDTKQNIT